MRGASDFLLFLACLSAVATEPLAPYPYRTSGSRIAGGDTATITDFPFAAALLNAWDSITFSQACGGTIITSRSILTCASCFSYDNRISAWRIRLGSATIIDGEETETEATTQAHGVSSITRHPRFNQNTVDFDVAIVRTVDPIVFSDTVAPATIAGVNYRVADGDLVTAIGWGSTETIGGARVDALRSVLLRTIPQATCRTQYSSLRTVTTNMLCAGWTGIGGRGQCHGDYGSPLLHDNVVVGIFSWGWQCGLAQFPGVNIRVSSFTTWIMNNA